MLSLNFLALALCASLSSAARLTISIASSSLLSNPASLPPSTHAVLIGPPGVRYDALIRRDSTFLFPDVKEASYLLTVHSRDHSFPPLRVDVGKAADESQQQSIQAWQTFRGNEWDNKGPSYGSGNGELHLQIQASNHKDFYQVRGGFDLLGFVKSPMILMALVSAAMIFGMPYIMENSTLPSYVMVAVGVYMLISNSGRGDESRVRADAEQDFGHGRSRCSKSDSELRSGWLDGWKDCGQQSVFR